jgi:hypothetical protein
MEPIAPSERQMHMGNLGKTLASVVVAAAVAAGCSSSNHAGAPASSTTRPAAKVGTSMSPKQAAVALGKRMLGEAVLPPGAQVSSAPLPAVLRAPGGAPAMGNLLFSHRTWTVSEAPHALWQWLQAHVPPGFVKDGTSSGSLRGVPSWGVQDRLAVFPANISYAELLYGIAGDASGKAVVRVDTEVGWTAPRPADEFVPARDRVVTVRVIHPYEPGKPVSKTVVVSDPKVVGPIVRSFNALRVSPPLEVHSCPPLRAISAVYEVAFSASVHASPDLVASIGGCGGVSVRVGGRPAPELGGLSSDGFGDAVAHVLGLPHPHFN